VHALIAPLGELGFPITQGNSFGRRGPDRLFLSTISMFRHLKGKNLRQQRPSHLTSASSMAERNNSGGPAPETQHAPAFEFSNLWRSARVNTLNLKNYILPVFNLSDPYARNFRLFVANFWFVI